jgi:hypothetical protein
MSKPSIVTLAACLLLACGSEPASNEAKPEQAKPAPNDKAEPEPNVKAEPEVAPTPPPPAFMSEPERLDPKGELIADHTRRAIPIDGLTRRGPENAPVVILACVDMPDAFVQRGQKSMAEVRAALPDVGAYYLRPYWNVLESAEAAAKNKHKPAIERIERTKLLARAMVAAERQSKIWEFHDALLAADKDQLTPDGLDALAEQAGLDVATWKTQLDDETTAAAVEAHRKACQELGVDKAVPAYFINGRMMRGSRPVEDVRYVIEVEQHGGFEKLPGATTPQ